MIPHRCAVKISAMTDTLFHRLRATLGPNPLASVRAGLIGKEATIDGPLGPRPLIYADYVASGRALRQVEEAVMAEVLPFYANSHTEASFVGGTMTRLRREARMVIRTACGAGPEHAVIFTGSGATAGLNRLVHLLGVARAVREGRGALMILGPYEHHSNILPWRESGAEVVELPESPAGGPDLEALDEVLARAEGRLTVGAFSAASNVTGLLTDVTAVTQRLNAAGARVVWDYAGGGPYLPITMAPGGARIDALVVSPHKFVGGPQASGVLLLRRDVVTEARPTLPGGGTVRFVSPEGHDYSPDVEAREEAGTPNVVGDLRAAMAFVVKEALMGALAPDWQTTTAARAVARWRDHPAMELLGNLDAPRLPILSFRVRDGQGGFVHQQLFTRMLSDHEGIQARGGCACAGPYVHHLLGLDPAASARLRAAILAGDEIQKPGFVRLNLSATMNEAETEQILAAVPALAARAAGLALAYRADPAKAIFRPRTSMVA